jgi:hypothetical protein
MSKASKARGRSERRQTHQGRSRNQQKGLSQSSVRVWGIVAIVLVCVLGLAFWYGSTTESGQQAWARIFPSQAAQGEEELPYATVAAADSCRRMPVFASQLQFGLRTVFGTALPGFTGLVIYDPDQDRMYQHPTWDDAGNLGAYVVDNVGNIFVAPAPLSSLELNPPEEQNQIYRVDSVTGEMEFYLRLTPAQPPNQFNPFGVVGLGLDCDTQSLYVASIAGSTPTEEVGRIYRVDLRTGEVADRLDGVDAIGLGVGIMPDGTRRLYYGLARTSEVRSLPLDAQGNFVDGDFRTEFALATLPGGRDHRANRIRFDGEGAMTVKGVEFNYSLQVTGQVEATNYRLGYLPETQSWELIDLQHESPTEGAATTP